MDELKLIRQFEGLFKDAGKLAVQLQEKAVVTSKAESGVRDVDIVTSADLEVQEYILSSLAKTALKNCEVVAEEDTPSKQLFASKSNLVLTLDPIDGTNLYADNKSMYSIIVTLHDKKRPIYTFEYFPKVDWDVRIVNDSLEEFGTRPAIEAETSPKTIVYSKIGPKGNPQETLGEVYDDLIRKGYSFKTKKEITQECGSTALFLLGLADGFFVEDGSAVDCLVAWHYALAKDYTVINDMDLSKTQKSTIFGGSEEYKGYYLALR